jgi:hypothetical protein
MLLRLVLTDGSPPASLLFGLMIEELGGTTYGVRFAEALPPVQVDMDQPETFAAFANAIYDTVLKYYNDEELEGGPFAFDEVLN